MVCIQLVALLVTSSNLPTGSYFSWDWIGLDFIGLKDWINNNNIYWKQLGLIL
jgi:hypothetical protein